MAGAGNIILNIPSGGPYMVRPQGNVFRIARQPEGQGLRTASDVMTLLAQAKGLADMVAPFISTTPQGAKDFDANRAQVADAMQDVRGMGQAQQAAQAQQSIGQAQADLAGARQAMEQAGQARGVEGMKMMQARDAARLPFGSPVQQLEQAVARVNAAQNLQELAAAQADYEHARMLLQNQGALDAPRPLSALESPLIQAAAQGAPQMPIMPPAPGLSLPGVLPPSPEQEPVRMLDPALVAQAAQPGPTSAGAGMPEATPFAAQQQMPAIQPQVGDEFAGTGYHPDDMDTRPRTLADVEANMRAAAAAGDVEAYNQALESLGTSPLEDVRARDVSDLATGAHYARAKQALMARVKPPDRFADLKAQNMRSLIQGRQELQEHRVAERARKDIELQLRRERDKVNNALKQLRAARIAGLMSLDEEKLEAARIKNAWQETLNRSRVALERAKRSQAYAAAGYLGARRGETLLRTDLTARTFESLVEKALNQAITSSPKFKERVAAARKKAQKELAKYQSDLRKEEAKLKGAGSGSKASAIQKRIAALKGKEAAAAAVLKATEGVSAYTDPTGASQRRRALGTKAGAAAERTELEGMDPLNLLGN